jgi:predicted porin
MKKTIITLAALAAGSAWAQSSVTLFGIVDATLAWGSGSLSKRTQLTNSGYNNSRLGFRGVEDLGGGMSASFWLEAGVNNDNGTGVATNTNNQASGGAIAGIGGGQGLTFNRRSTVSLAGGWGELRLGRDYTPQFWNVAVFDPFGVVGVGTSQAIASLMGGPVAVRSSNGIGYLLPANLGGLYGQAQYYLGENASTAGATKNDGTGGAVRVGWASGPWNAAVAFSSTRYASGTIRQANVGGQYDFGFAKVMANYTVDTVRSTPEVTGRGGLLGALVPVGPGEIRVAYSRYRTDAAGDPRSTKLALGYVHNLSKRTALYATFAHVSNAGGAAQALNGSTTAANGSSRGIDLGVRHAF